MKIKLLFLLVAVAALTTESYGQISFGVSPGSGYNSAYFGYKIADRIVPFVGFQCIAAKFNIEQSGQEWDYELNKVVPYSGKIEFSGSLLVPNIGVKCFMTETNKIKTYLSLSLSKPILSAKLEIDGEQSEEFQEGIKNISMWGGEFGVGVEYFFDENFSVGGEFGLRYLNVKYHNTMEDDYYNPITNEYVDSESTFDLRYTMNPTYSKISLNYYF